MTLVLGLVLTAWTNLDVGRRNGCLLTHPTSQWLLIVYKFHPLDLFLKRKRPMKLTEQMEINRVPLGIRPIEFLLHILVQVIPVNLKANYFIVLTDNAETIDGDRRLHLGEVVSLFPWEKQFLYSMLCCKSIYRNIIFRVARQSFSL